MTEAVPVDPGAIVAEIEAEVRRKRAAGEYPEALLARLRSEFRPDDALEPPEVLALLEPARPLRSERPLAGRGIVFGKRVIRRFISWYVAPIAQDQTRFNVAVVRELRALERRLARLETVWPEPNDRPQVSTAPPPSADELTTARVGAALTAMKGVAPAVVVVAGGSTTYAAELVARRPQVEVVEGDALDRLRSASAASASAVVLPCVLPRLSPRELLEIIPLCARVLRQDGLLLCDAPDPTHPDTPSSAADVEPALRQHISFETVAVIAKAAGFEHVQRESLVEGRWYLAVASRSGQR
jgi:predicted SAM-dependent methyltransferase